MASKASMSTSGNKKTWFRGIKFCRFVVTTITTIFGLSLTEPSRADVIFGDIANLDFRLGSSKPLDALKVETNKSAFVTHQAFYHFAQDNAPLPEPGALGFCHASSRLGLTCVAAPVLFSTQSSMAEDEKSIRYVQAKNFKHYVIPNNLENPSEMERIALSHQAFGTQSKMLVMAK
jgi:hypothetical protein